jgi:hypothetical protein
MARVSSLIASGSLVFVGLSIVGAAPLPVSLVRPVVITKQLQNQEQVRAFAGTIISQNSGIFVLQNDANKMLYGLDNQALASKFLGKKVSVTGTLDKTGTIHVVGIEVQKA